MFMMAACLKKGHEQVAMVHTHPKPACRRTQSFSLQADATVHKHSDWKGRLSAGKDLPATHHGDVPRMQPEGKLTTGSQTAKVDGRAPRKKAQCCWKKATRCCRCLRLRPHR